MNLEALRDKTDALLAERSRAVSRAREEKQMLRAARERLSHCEAAREIVQQTAQTAQQSAHEAVASVVTRCLRAVFGPDAYTFGIDFRKARGRTEARLLFRRGGKEFDPTEASGGGVVDVSSFALRLAALLLSRPRRRLFLCLDEPFKHVSREYRPKVAELLETLCEELGLQALLVTHDEDFFIGKVMKL